MARARNDKLADENQSLRQELATVRKMRERARKMRDSHFSYKGTMQQIALFLRAPGAATSDLRCISRQAVAAPAVAVAVAVSIAAAG